MAVWSVGIEPDRKSMGVQYFWTQRSAGLSDMPGRALVQPKSRSHPSGNSEACIFTRCVREALHQGGYLARCMSSIGSCSSDRQHGECQEGVGLNNFCRHVWRDDQLVAMDVEMGHRASISNWSVPAALDTQRPAGCGKGVSVETVHKLCEQGQLAEAVEAMGVLVHTECYISTSLLYTVLKECVAKKDLALGRCIHALIVRTGYDSDTFLCNQILRMYASHARLQEAMDVFSMVADPDVFTWCAIISAHSKHEQDRKAIELYHSMRRSRVKPNGHVFVAALQACAREADLKAGQQVHADVIASGVEPDLFVCSCLVDMYAKCGSLEDAQRVFDGLLRKDVVTWNVMIGGYSQQSMGEKALHLYSAMLEDGTAAANSVTFVCLLQACGSVGSAALEKGKQLHAQIRKEGLEADMVVGGSLVNMYAKCGSIDDAWSVFSKLGQKNVVTWNAMIGGYSQRGIGHEALNLYKAMQEEGMVEADSVTFVSLLQACASVGSTAVEQGKLLHKHIRERGLQADMFVASSLVDMYAKCGSLEDADSVFKALPQKDVVTWSAMIAGYSKQGLGKKALELFSVMQEEDLAAPNSVTYVCLLQACASVGTPALKMGKQLHAQIRELQLQADVFVANSLVNMYTKCGNLKDARVVFDSICGKTLVTWSAMIAGYSQHGMGQEALELYRAMKAESMAALDPMIFVSLLQACASVGTPAYETGKQLHAHIREQQGLLADVFVASSLVNMYAKCGSLEDARILFDGLGQKNVVTWSAMIAGYSQQGMGQDSLCLYKEMLSEGLVAPNSVTFVGLLQACGSVAALHLGKQLHAQIKEQGLQADVLVAGSLIDMYGKCGSMADAMEVFEALPKRDVSSWNALIAGYTRQGNSEEVFDLVSRMGEDGIDPDGITFLCLLSVCNHTGLVNKGQEYFKAMGREYNVTPTVDHYVCIVDLLGRAGQLEEALSVVRTMPVLPNSAVWHTLLGACRKWNNVNVGRHAFDEAVKLDKKDVSAYMLMSNIYTGVQMWEQRIEMQAWRKSMRAWKQPGQSWWTDMDGLVHSFLVGEMRHC